MNDNIDRLLTKDAFWAAYQGGVSWMTQEHLKVIARDWATLYVCTADGRLHFFVEPGRGAGSREAELRDRFPVVVARTLDYWQADAPYRVSVPADMELLRDALLNEIDGLWEAFCDAIKDARLRGTSCS